MQRIVYSEGFHSKCVLKMMKILRGPTKKGTQYLLALFKYHFSQSFLNLYCRIKAAMSLRFRECSMKHAKLPPMKIFKFHF